MHPACHGHGLLLRRIQQPPAAGSWTGGWDSCVKYARYKAATRYTGSAMRSAHAAVKCGLLHCPSNSEVPYAALTGGVSRRMGSCRNDWASGNWEGCLKCLLLLPALLKLVAAHMHDAQHQVVSGREPEIIAGN